jgi:predicted molibdopterin-dependent oxidoreductase YjgC
MFRLFTIDFKGVKETMSSSAYRIQDNIQRGEAFTISVDEKTILAYPGETLATAMMANGMRVIRHTAIKGSPRGLYCGMGICYDCLITVNGRTNVRACQTIAQPDDIVESQS